MLKTLHRRPIPAYLIILTAVLAYHFREDVSKWVRRRWVAPQVYVPAAFHGPAAAEFMLGFRVSPICRGIILMPIDNADFSAGVQQAAPKVDPLLFPAPPGRPILFAVETPEASIASGYVANYADAAAETCLAVWQSWSPSRAPLAAAKPRD